MRPDAYYEGARAAEGGLSRAVNPYVDDMMGGDDSNAEYWEQGFNDAMAHERALMRERMADRYGDEAADDY